MLNAVNNFKFQLIDRNNSLNNNKVTNYIPISDSEFCERNTLQCHQIKVKGDPHYNF